MMIPAGEKSSLPICCNKPDLPELYSNTLCRHAILISWFACQRNRINTIEWISKPNCMSQNYWLSDFGFDIHSSLTPSLKEPLLHKFYLGLEVKCTITAKTVQFTVNYSTIWVIRGTGRNLKPRSKFSVTGMQVDAIWI